MLWRFALIATWCLCPKMKFFDRADVGGSPPRTNRTQPANANRTPPLRCPLPDDGSWQQPCPPGRSEPPARLFVDAMSGEADGAARPKASSHRPVVGSERAWLFLVHVHRQSRRFKSCPLTDTNIGSATRSRYPRTVLQGTAQPRRLNLTSARLAGPRPVPAPGSDRP